MIENKILVTNTPGGSQMYPNASQVNYDNSSSGIVATNAQTAIDTTFDQIGQLGNYIANIDYDIAQKLNDKVSLVSTTNQVINSDLTLDVGKKLFGTTSTTQQHELIGLNEYSEGQQIEIGSEYLPLCLNHKAIADWSDERIAVNYEDENGQEYEDTLAYYTKDVAGLIRQIDHLFMDIDKLDKNKANIYQRLAVGITTGNNIQGMHMKPVDRQDMDEWELLTANNDWITSGHDWLEVHIDGVTTHLVQDGEVLVDDYIIEAPFLIDRIYGNFSNPNLFYRYFDIKDLDQRIGLVSALNTNDKSSIVNAINSLKTYVDAFLQSSEVQGSPYDSYADFLAGAGGTVQQSKYAYVSFPTLSGIPSGGNWDNININDTWRLDCSDTAWSPTSNMTASSTATISDATGNNVLAPAGNDTVTNWLQSFRNNLKFILNKFNTDGLIPAANLTGIAKNQGVTVINCTAANLQTEINKLDKFITGTVTFNVTGSNTGNVSFGGFTGINGLIINGDGSQIGGTVSCMSNIIQIQFSNCSMTNYDGRAQFSSFNTCSVTGTLNQNRGAIHFGPNGGTVGTMALYGGASLLMYSGTINAFGPNSYGTMYKAGGILPALENITNGIVIFDVTPAYTGALGSIAYDRFVKRQPGLNVTLPAANVQSFINTLGKYLSGAVTINVTGQIANNLTIAGFTSGNGGSLIIQGEDSDTQIANAVLVAGCNNARIHIRDCKTGIITVRDSHVYLRGVHADSLLVQQYGCVSLNNSTVTSTNQTQIGDLSLYDGGAVSVYALTTVNTFAATGTGTGILYINSQGALPASYPATWLIQDTRPQTLEHFAGYWYDGKPVFKRMFKGNIIAAAGVIDTTLLIGSNTNPIRTEGRWQIGGTYDKYQANSYVANGTYATIVYINGTGIALRSSSTLARTGTTYNAYSVTVYYTKN